MVFCIKTMDFIINKGIQMLMGRVIDRRSTTRSWVHDGNLLSGKSRRHGGALNPWQKAKCKAVSQTTCLLIQLKQPPLEVRFVCDEIYLWQQVAYILLQTRYSLGNRNPVLWTSLAHLALESTCTGEGLGSPYFPKKSKLSIFSECRKHMESICLRKTSKRWDRLWELYQLKYLVSNSFMLQLERKYKLLLIFLQSYTLSLSLSL